jgi:hypothetical protein
MTLAKLSIGIQDFGELITGHYTYIDKTQWIHQVVTGGKPYFLSRPRRFGKSLLVSTIEALFLGKRELFKGLWIDKSDWDWKVYPVIRLDMSTLPNRSLEAFEEGLNDRLISIAKQYQVELKKDHRLPQTLLLHLLAALAEKYANVVVLIDEYDKPLLDQIENLKLALEIRNSLKEFYSILKAEDARLKFVFLTGVTKFSKVSVFSGLNNLIDLTMDDHYSGLLGYTRKEIEHYFSNNVAAISKHHALTREDCYAKMTEWYNGYQFSAKGTSVYNPFSILKFLSSGTFNAHWFETATPTFLIKLLKKREFDLIDIEGLQISASAFNTFEIEDIPLLPLLYQTGYLTIKEYEPILSTFRLGFPNREVSQAFSESLLQFFSTEEAQSANDLSQICYNLLPPEWDYAEFFSILERLLALIPYDLYIKQEKHFHSLFYLIIKLAGIKISAEVHTQKGRLDAALEMKNKIIIFEFKLNETAEIALNQIKEKAYFKFYQDRKLPIYLVGINFNGEQRAMNEWLVERLT